MKKEILKEWFKTGAKPTQQQFWSWIDSFWHKEESIPSNKIKGLSEVISEQNELIGNVATMLDIKVDKVEGKGLSTNDFTDLEKDKLAELHNYDDTEIRQTIDATRQKVEGKADLSGATFTGPVSLRPSEGTPPIVIGQSQTIASIKSGSLEHYGGKLYFTSQVGSRRALVTENEIVDKILYKGVGNKSSYSDKITANSTYNKVVSQGFKPKVASTRVYGVNFLTKLYYYRNSSYTPRQVTIDYYVRILGNRYQFSNYWGDKTFGEAKQRVKIATILLSKEFLSQSNVNRLINFNQTIIESYIGQVNETGWTTWEHVRSEAKVGSSRVDYYDAEHVIRYLVDTVNKTNVNVNDVEDLQMRIEQEVSFEFESDYTGTEDVGAQRLDVGHPFVKIINQ